MYKQHSTVYTSFKKNDVQLKTSSLERINGNLCFATLRGSAACARILLEEGGASPRYRDFAPLMNLSSRSSDSPEGDQEGPLILRALMDADPSLDLDVLNGSALTNAVMAGNAIGTLSALLYHGRFAESHLDTALHTAIVESNLTAVRCMLARPEVSRRARAFDDGALFRAVETLVKNVTRKHRWLTFDGLESELAIVELLVNEHGASFLSRKNEPLLLLFCRSIGHIMDVPDVACKILNLAMKRGDLGPPSPLLLPEVRKRLSLIASGTKHAATLRALLLSSIEGCVTHPANMAAEVLFEVENGLLSGYARLEEDTARVLVDTFKEAHPRFETRLAVAGMLGGCKTNQSDSYNNDISADVLRVHGAMNVSDKRDVFQACSESIVSKPMNFHEYRDRTVASETLLLSDESISGDIALAQLVRLLHNGRHMSSVTPRFMRACWNRIKHHECLREKLSIETSRDVPSAVILLVLKSRIIMDGDIATRPDVLVRDALRALDIDSLRGEVNPVIIALVHDNLPVARTLIHNLGANTRVPFPLPSNLDASVDRQVPFLSELARGRRARQFQWDFCDGHGTFPLLLLHAIVSRQNVPSYKKRDFNVSTVLFSFSRDFESPILDEDVKLVRKLFDLYFR